MKSTPLTILLTLKGRHFHTLRWIWHANRIGLPFHVVMADGEVNPIVAKIMDDPSNFPNLSYEYHHYADNSFSDFYRKCADAIAKVLTPFVMMSDNDDFLMPTGILKSIAFLQQAEDYVCSSGGISGFGIDSSRKDLPPNVVGKFNNLLFKYFDTYYFCNVSHPSAIERIKFAAQKAGPLYYHVFHTEALRLIFDEIRELDFSDLQIHEAFTAFRSLTLGKANSDETSISYFRQIGTSSGFNCEFDWVHHLLRSRYTSDFTKMVTHIAQPAASVDCVDQSEVEETIRLAYAEFLRSQLSRQYGTSEKIESIKNLVRKMLPTWLLDARLRGFKSVEAQRRNFVERLKQAGASRDYLNSFSLELRQIEETLEGRAFLDFVHSTVGKNLSALY